MHHGEGYVPAKMGSGTESSGEEKGAAPVLTMTRLLR